MRVPRTTGRPLQTSGLIEMRSDMPLHYHNGQRIQEETRRSSASLQTHVFKLRMDIFFIVVGRAGFDARAPIDTLSHIQSGIPCALQMSAEAGNSFGARGQIEIVHSYVGRENAIAGRPS
jgi:hypothetical protein